MNARAVENRERVPCDRAAEDNRPCRYDRYRARFFDVFKKFSGRLLSADEMPAGWSAP
jgi:hypothetical protein